jgi:hypothetical protein
MAHNPTTIIKKINASVKDALRKADLDFDEMNMSNPGFNYYSNAHKDWFLNTWGICVERYYAFDLENSNNMLSSITSWRIERIVDEEKFTLFKLTYG